MKKNITHTFIAVCTLPLLALPSAIAAGTPTFKAGTTTTGAPGTAASVQIKKKGNTVTFNFTIPQGAPGAEGNAGLPGIVGPVGPAGADGSGTGQIADGSITNAKLAKPPQSGSIDVATKTTTVPINGNGPFSVTFPQAFSSTPVVTASLVSALDNPGQVVVTNVSSTGFSGNVTGVSPGIYVGGNDNCRSFLSVNGRPATNQTDGYYLRANNANGSSWGNPIKVTGLDGSSEDAFLAIANGNPAALFYTQQYDQNTSSDFYRISFVRSTDSDGNTWGSPVVVFDELNYSNPFGFSFTNINGNPALVYAVITSDNNTLTCSYKYIRANDTNGNTWGSPITIDTTTKPGNGYSYYDCTSLTTVNGRPAIAYYDALNFDLKYVRANDADGTTWGTPTTLASIGNVGQNPSLVVVNGRPAISFYDETNGDLKYIRANNADGTSWGSALTLDATGDVGYGTSLAIISGNPAISYADFTNYTSKYIAANDVDGTSWATAFYKGGSSGSTFLLPVNGLPAILTSNGTYLRGDPTFKINWIALQP